MSIITDYLWRQFTYCNLKYKLIKFSKTWLDVSYERLDNLDDLNWIVLIVLTFN